MWVDVSIDWFWDIIGDDESFLWVEESGVNVRNRWCIMNDMHMEMHAFLSQNFMVYISRGYYERGYYMELDDVKYIHIPLPSNIIGFISE